MTRTFDYSAFKAAFRASAAAHGIDPAAGATSYQAANLKADLRKAEIVAAADYGWWRGRDIFSETDSVRTSSPMRTVAVARGGLEKHQEAWGEAVSSRKRAVWVPGAGLPVRQLIPSY